LVQLTDARVDVLRILEDRLLNVHRIAGRAQLLQVLEVREHFIPLAVGRETARAELRRLRNHAAGIEGHLRFVVDLLLIEDARRSLCLTLLRLMNRTLLGAKLLVLDFEARRFGVFAVVLLKLTSLYRARFLQ